MTAEADDRMMSAELENILHIIPNHSCTLSTQQHLTNQIEHLRGENQQLKAALRQAELRLSIMEREKACQHAALSEKICNVDQLTLEKQQMTAELGVRRMQLTQLKEGQKALKELLEREKLQLKTQLRTVQAELDQANSYLRTLEGADGHGLKIALGMQKQITAKREQTDFLRSRIQLLEENIEKLKMEKHRQALLVMTQTRELLSEKKSRRRLESEVEALCSQEQELKGKAERLKAALYKELKSQNLRNVSRSPVGSQTLQTHLPLTQHNINGLMEMRISDPIVELKSSVRELRGGIAEEQGPHTTLSFRRRPKEDHKSRQPTETRGAKSTKRSIGRTTSYSEPGSFRKAEPNKHDINSPLSADNNAVNLMTGRRSPVHLLLTSDLPADGNCWLKMESPVNANQISASNQDDLAGKASRKMKTVEATEG
ncbi:coiled-coil domain-containing protein 158-like isoform X2 [Puntigrus tetrazona]|uniref:coiled-coil domain-containing protein 158-like isoform X2 n=1 Tax=Puntigrus tetrazona TaxID=1606681 RepID=UPI001C899DC3|nr:coiled-coil domain-containing protein 158-like isoform X2 [Puntigrus tetrazona]